MGTPIVRRRCGTLRNCILGTMLASGTNVDFTAVTALVSFAGGLVCIKDAGRRLEP